MFLVKGDVSGIQDFIFNVNSKGAAQSLKGRSFFIKILLQVAMRKIFDDCRTVNETLEGAKISTSGGNFILRLKEVDPKEIDAIQLAFSRALQYTGLNIMLQCEELGESYRQALIHLNQKIRERKQMLLLNEISFFTPFDRSKINAVNANAEWTQITDQLKSKSHFAIDKDTTRDDDDLFITGQYIHLAGYRVSFGNKGTRIDDFLESVSPTGKTFKELAVDGGERGIQKLGVLAMDADNLGAALEKVRNYEEHMDFDRDLREFFNVELRDSLKAKIFRDKVYVVTAGGDDSFFVGKWNTMLDLAIEIHRAFNVKFAEKDISISAALVLVDPKFPVVRFAQMAEEALKDAKYRYDRKGNINLFGEVLDWDVLTNEIYKLRDTFNRNRKDLITSGLLAKARSVALQVVDDEGLRLSVFWKMGYYMRNFPRSKTDPILKDYKDFLIESMKESNKIRKRSYRLIFPVAARLAEFDNR